MHVNDVAVSKRFEDIFESISTFFDKHPQWSKELIIAKGTFFSLTGKIGESDNEFGNRMNAFLCWFIFDYKLPSAGTVPFNLFLEYSKKENLATDLGILQSQKEHIHSLFYFIKEKRDQIVIKDLYSGQNYKVSGSHVLVGQEKEACFETRLFEFGGKYYFANYFIYHPVIARKDIKRQVKLIRKKKEPIKPFLLKLHLYHTKWRRYRNINIRSIYHFDESVPEAK